MPPKRIGRLCKQAVSAWLSDYAPSMGAALAYYTLFSIAPLLIIVIAVAGLVFGPDAAQGAIIGQLQELLGYDGAAAIQGLIKSAGSSKGGWVSTVIGVVTLFVGATTVFAELEDDLNRVWRAPAKQPTAGLWSLIRARILSFGMILGIGFLLIVSLVASAAIAGLGRLWSDWFGPWEVLLHAVNFVISFVLITVFFASIYKIMPRVKVGWRDVWLGAAVTALLFTVGKTLIGLYLGKASVASAFGAAGSLIVALLWTYYAAQIFLLGAEFTSVYAHRYGSLQGQAASV
jgi:membrane protein